MDLKVRAPTAADAPALATLVTQLGYPARAEVIPARLDNLAKASDAIVLVAEDESANVVALMTARIFPVIHHDAPLAWLTALVVLDSARGKGIGSMLLERAEQWAIQRGAHKISLSSAMHRTETHGYYDNRGYERSGLRFTKKFGASYGLCLNFVAVQTTLGVSLNRTSLSLVCTVFVVACGGGGEGSKCTGCDTPTAPQPLQPVAWVDGVWTQPVPSSGSPVRLNLPVPLSSIDLSTAGGGFGAFGAHEGGHVEGLNHIWIPTSIRTIRSWAAGTVTQIQDQGLRSATSGVHEWFITIDYGQGLIGTHLDVDFPKVTVGQHVNEGDIVADAPSAEFKLIDNRRNDGERTGGSTGAAVSPFDYLRDDVKASVVTRYINEVVTPFFASGKSIGTQRPWEPLLTNKMLFHNEHKNTPVGEWIMISKSWNVVDPLYYDVLAIFDVSNSYGHFRNIEMEDHDWSLPGNKNHISGTWVSEAPGKIILTLERGAPLYGLYSVDESSGRAKLTLELKLGSYPTAITSNAAVYTERAAVYLGLDAQTLGIVH